MNDILKIRNELSQFIAKNNNELTSDDVIKKALEAELKLNSIAKTY
jgi:ribosomal protein S3AE